MARGAKPKGRTCIKIGCDQKHDARGLCHTHYVQALRAGQLPQVAEKPSAWEKLLSQSEWDGDCLRWTGHHSPGGYGRISWGGTSHQVHRLSYQERVGVIPDGMHVDHVRARGCRFLDCFNPDHLEPVTPAENVRRQARRDTDTCPEGHPYTPRADGSGWRECVSCRVDRQTRKVTCECGAVVSRNNLRSHRTRKVHEQAMAAKLLYTTEELA